MSLVYRLHWDQEVQGEPGHRYLASGAVTAIRIGPVKFIHEHAPQEFVPFSERQFLVRQVVVTYRKGRRLSVRWVGWKAHA